MRSRILPQIVSAMLTVAVALTEPAKAIAHEVMHQRLAEAGPVGLAAAPEGTAAVHATASGEEHSFLHRTPTAARSAAATPFEPTAPLFIAAIADRPAVAPAAPRASPPQSRLPPQHASRAPPGP